MEDAQIIQLLKMGDKYDQGMNALVAKYGGLIKYMLQNILGNKNEWDIEECLSDVLCEFWLHIDDYDLSKGSLKSYLIGMARYIALNRYRELSKYQKRNVLFDENTFMSRSDKNMENEILNGLDQEVVKAVILSMERPDKDIFIRRYFWFEKVKDIAKALNLDSKQVENRLYKGKEKLRILLAQRGVEK